MIDKIKDSIYAIKTKIRNFYLGIKSILYWIPIIKNDRWYDYGYLDILIHHKLKQMEDGFRNSSSNNDAQLIANELKDISIDMQILISSDEVFPNYSQQYIDFRKKAYTLIGEKSSNWWD